MDRCRRAAQRRQHRMQAPAAGACQVDALGCIAVEFRTHRGQQRQPAGESSGSARSSTASCDCAPAPCPTARLRDTAVYSITADPNGPRYGRTSKGCSNKACAERQRSQNQETPCPRSDSRSRWSICGRSNASARPACRPTGPRQCAGVMRHSMDDNTSTTASLWLFSTLGGEAPRADALRRAKTAQPQLVAPSPRRGQRRRADRLYRQARAAGPQRRRDPSST